MNDLTLLYYTAHKLPDDCAERVRAHLLESGAGLPIISVSQKPLNFGENICVGEIGQSFYNCYKQIYVGVQKVKTPFVACCEDDTLYNPEHFAFRPAEDAFYYNKSMWYLEGVRKGVRRGGIFWHKWQTGMFGCITRADLLLKVLKKRFDFTPEEPMPRRHYATAGWQEPGRFDGERTEFFKTKIPLITFNYFNALGGKARSVVHKPAEETYLDYWGDATKLKDNFWHGKND